MLKDNIIKIKTRGNRKLPYFESLGYKVDGEFITINIKDLNSGSRELVNVTCDFCKKEVNIPYKEYLRNIGIGNKYACSKYCGSEKAKESNIDKYGVVSALQLDDIKEKQKRTNLEKYGVEYLQQSAEIKEKSKKTLLKKYNVDHISKVEENRNRHSDWLGSDEFKIKAKETLFKNYGVDNPTKSSVITDKLKNTLSKKKEENWKIISEKNKKTNINRYGVDNPMKSEDIRKSYFDIAKHKDYIKYLFNGISKFHCNTCDSEFEIKSDNYFKRLENNLSLCTICHPIGDSSSIREKELYQYVKSIYNGNIVASYRDRLEIDIYLPELKLGFEFNGLYWHSEEYKDRNYHLNKTNYFKERGIRIIHIWEDDWINKNDILKSQINNWIGLNINKIYARKCVIKEVKDIKIARDFLNMNHIQGSDKSVLKLGLHFNEKLVSLMTFDKSEGRKKMEEGGWNLSRFCNVSNTNVIGSASKLLTYFIKNYNPIRIVSYADKTWSQGNVYYKLSFEKVHDTNPDYKYIIDGKRRHKSNFKKSKLNTNLRESDFMYRNNIYKIWDCGKIKFQINI